MMTIRGVYDGKAIKPLPTESLPDVDHEVPVAITFLEEIPVDGDKRKRQAEIVKRMRDSRQAMQALAESVKDLVEAGRER
jgi:hypothetical protein